MIKIYLIKNLLTDPIMTYVGKTKNSLEERFKEHVNMHDRSLLGLAFKEFGYRHFTIELLEEIEIEDKKIITERETFWIKNKNSHFQDGNGYNLKYEIVSDKIEKTYYGLDKNIILENIKNGNKWNFGLKANEEMKRKISKTLKIKHELGLIKTGHLHTEDTKKHISEKIKKQYEDGRITWSKGKKFPKRIWIYNIKMKKRKFVLEKDYLDFIKKGWKNGKGSVWMNDGNKNFSISEWQTKKGLKYGKI